MLTDRPADSSHAAADSDPIPDHDHADHHPETSATFRRYMRCCAPHFPPVANMLALTRLSLGPLASCAQRAKAAGVSPSTAWRWLGPQPFSGWSAKQKVCWHAWRRVVHIETRGYRAGGERRHTNIMTLVPTAPAEPLEVRLPVARPDPAAGQAVPEPYHDDSPSPVTVTVEHCHGDSDSPPLPLPPNAKRIRYDARAALTDQVGQELAAMDGDQGDGDHRSRGFHKLAMEWLGPLLVLEALTTTQEQHRAGKVRHTAAGLFGAVIKRIAQREELALPVRWRPKPERSTAYAQAPRPRDPAPRKGCDRCGGKGMVYAPGGGVSLCSCRKAPTGWEAHREARPVGASC